MKAMAVANPGPEGVLRLVEVDDPTAGAHEVVVDVVAAGVNRADTSQRKGNYDPPAGASIFPGLECSGVISQVGAEVQGWSVGDQVCALLAGGGYAEKVAVPAGQLLRAPSALTLVDAAALPESAATVWSNLFGLVGLRAGETVLIHGGSSGIGTMAIQLAIARGVTVAATAGSAEKLSACKELGASILINYRTEDFVARIHAETGGIGVDVVLDIVGADYLQRNIDVLGDDGRLVVVGIQSGADANFDLRSMLKKRANIVGSVLRGRPVAEKAAIMREVAEHVMPLVESGAVAPVIHTVMPLADANKAHALVESSHHIGKVVLTTGFTG